MKNYIEPLKNLKDIGIKLSDFEEIKTEEKNYTLLGSGNFGYVEKMKSKKNNKIYAIKKIDKNSQKFKPKDFLRETQIMFNLNHENIIKFYGYFEDKENLNKYKDIYNNKMDAKDLNKIKDDIDVYCLVLEYAKNGSLREFYKNKIKNRDKNLVPIEEKDIINILKQLLSGLKYLHDKGVMHRDITPDNILLDEKNNVKITDFGISAVHKDSKTKNTIIDDNMISNKTVVGRISYASPEIHKGDNYDYSSDVYSLGVTILYMMSYENPILVTKNSKGGKDRKLCIENMHQEYNPYLQKLILRMVKDDPKVRPTSSHTYDELEVIEIFKDKPNNKIIKKCLDELNKEFNNNINLQNNNNKLYHSKSFNQNDYNINHLLHQINLNFNNHHFNLNTFNIYNNLNINNNMNHSFHNVLMTQNVNLSQNYEDIYPYIKDNKIRITFINQKNENKNVLIPSSLRNNELYYTAEKINNHNFYEYSDITFIELIYQNNNKIIQNNDDLIGHYINDNSQIFIKEKIENQVYNQNDTMINIIFKSNNKNIALIIPNNITVKDMIGIFFNKNKIPEQNKKYFTFLINGKEININDNTLYNEGYKNGSTITILTNRIKNDYNFFYLKRDCPGKKINAILKDKKSKNEINAIIFAGTLQQIKNFYLILKKYLSQQKIEFTGSPIITYNNARIEVDEYNESTFSSLGIRNDFFCELEVKK